VRNKRYIKKCPFLMKPTFQLKINEKPIRFDENGGLNSQEKKYPKRW